MDGTRRKSRTTNSLLARRAASLALAACALIGAAPAQADPATDFAAGTAGFAAADQIARDYWQATPCAGQVAVVWMPLAPSTNATSTWTNPVGQYDAPDQNATCQITFNAALTWDWTRFCSILVHEYGHLVGHAHSPDEHDVMYAFYEAPVAQCVAAAPADVVAAPAPAPAAGSAGRIAQPRAITASRSVRQGALALVRPHRHHRHHRGRHAHRHHRHGHRHHRVGKLTLFRTR